MEVKINPVRKIEGQIKVPGDKSISHRAMFFSSLAEDTVEVEGVLQTEDTMATLNCLSELGVKYEENASKLIIKGSGLRGFEEPDNILNAGSSEITASLLTGLLAGQPFYATVTGNNSLRERHMKSITEPLQQMGAFISGRCESVLLPLSIRGFDLLPINHDLPVPSSQVKSALLTAALYSRGISEIIDPYNTRDHTERMLQHLGADIRKMGKHHITLKSPVRLRGERILIPGDISAAAHFILAASLAPHGELHIAEVGINPTRSGIIDVLNMMGADISVLNEREHNCEPVADLLVKGGAGLRGVEVSGEIIPRVIDEIPIITVAALFADGDTIIKGDNKVRFEESVRFQTIVGELQKMGASIQKLPDGIIINGNAKLKGCGCNSHGDPGIAMALATAALFMEEESFIDGAEAVDNLFPHYFEVMNGLAS